MKKIIALAVASAFVAPAVMAEVTVYGFLAPSVEYSKYNNAGSAYDVSRIRLVDNASRIGFKGTDKLDNGLKVFWQVENRVRVGNGDYANTGWNTRETFVGLQGNFGKVFVGQHNDLVWQSRPDYMPGLNYFNESVDGVHKFTNMSAEGRVPNIVQYETPNTLGGFKAKVVYDFGDKTNAKADDPTTTTVNEARTAKKVNGVQATALYANKMFKVGATYKVVNNGTDTGDFEDGYGSVAESNYLKSYIVGGTVTPVKGLNISAMWSKKKVRSAGVITTDQDAFAIGANYMTGRHGFGLHYGIKGDNGDTANSGAQLVIAQYKYSLSKQTYVHASVGYGKGDDNSKVSYGTTKGTFSDLGTLTTTNNNSVTTIATGIRTNF